MTTGFRAQQPETPRSVLLRCGQRRHSRAVGGTDRARLFRRHWTQDELVHGPWLGAILIGVGWAALGWIPIIAGIAIAVWR